MTLKKVIVGIFGLVLMFSFSCKEAAPDIISENVSVEIWSSMTWLLYTETLIKGQSFSYSLDRSGFEAMAVLYKGTTPDRYVEGGSLPFTPDSGQRIILFPQNGVYQAWKNAGHGTVSGVTGPGLAHGTQTITVSRKDWGGATMPESIWFNGGQTIKYTDANGVKQDSGLYAVFDQINNAISGIGSVTKVSSGGNFEYGYDEFPADGMNDHYRAFINYLRIVTGKLDTKAEVQYLVRTGLAEAVENITAIDDPDLKYGIGPGGVLAEHDIVGFRWVFYKANLTPRYTSGMGMSIQSESGDGFSQLAPDEPERVGIPIQKAVNNKTKEK